MASPYTNLGSVGAVKPTKADADPLLVGDPEQSYRRSLAGYLAQQATDASPVYGWGGGIGRVIAGLGAGYFTGKAGEEEAAASARDLQVRDAVRKAYNNPPEGVSAEDAAWKAAQGSPRIAKALSDQFLKDMGGEHFEPIKNDQGATIGQKSTKSGKVEYFPPVTQSEGSRLLSPGGQSQLQPVMPKTEPGMTANDDGSVKATPGFSDVASALARSRKGAELGAELEYRPQILAAETPALVDRHGQTARIDFGNSSALQGQAAANAVDLQRRGFQNTLDTPQAFHEGSTVSTPRQLGFTGGGGPLPPLAAPGGGGPAPRPPGLFGAGGPAPVAPPVAVGVPPAPQPQPAPGAMPPLAQAARLPLPPVNAAPRAPVQASPLQAPAPAPAPALAVPPGTAPAPAPAAPAAASAPGVTQLPGGGVLIGGTGAQRAGETEGAKLRAEEFAGFGKRMQANNAMEQQISSAVKAFQAVESGRFKESEGEIARALNAIPGGPSLTEFLGLPKPAQLQILNKVTTKLAFSGVAAVDKQPAVIEFKMASQANPGAELEPAANHELLSQMLGGLRHDNDLIRHGQKVQVNGVPPAGWDIGFHDANPLAGYIENARKEIGPLAGMAGAQTAPPPVITRNAQGQAVVAPPGAAAAAPVPVPQAAPAPVQPPPVAPAPPARPAGSNRAALDAVIERRHAASAPPAVAKMGLDDLGKLDPSKMSPEELAAAARRFNELSGGR